MPRTSANSQLELCQCARTRNARRAQRLRPESLKGSFELLSFVAFFSALLQERSSLERRLGARSRKPMEVSPHVNLKKRTKLKV